MAKVRRKKLLQNDSAQKMLHFLGKMVIRFEGGEALVRMERMHTVNVYSTGSTQLLRTEYRVDPLNVDFL